MLGLCLAIRLLPARAERDPVIHVSAYGLESYTGVEPTFEVRAEPIRLILASSERIPASRPLLIVLDPASYSLPGLRALPRILAGALTRSGERELPFAVRFGLPVLDGVLSDSITDPRKLEPTLGNMIVSYISQPSLPEEGNLSRTLDLAARLLEKAEAEGGALDCLLVGKDRRFEGPDAALLDAGAERLILEACSRRGATFYGMMEGSGLLSDICLATGGRLFSSDRSLASVIRQILQARGGGFLLALRFPPGSPQAGRLNLEVRACTTAQAEWLALRAPRTVQFDFESAGPSDLLHLRRSLDNIRRAQTALRDENLALALSLLDASIQQYPSNPEAHFLAGRTAAALGQWPEALAFLGRAAQFYPPSAEALGLYADISVKLGRSAEALDVLRRPYRQDSSEPPFLRLQAGRLLVSLGKDEEARAEYETLPGTESDDDRMRAEYGALLWRHGDAQAAMIHVQAALAKNPSNVEALACASEIAVFQGRLKEALTLGQRAVRTDPRNIAALAGIGRAKMALKDWDGATGAIRSALAVAPERVDLLLLLSDALAGSGRTGDAVQTLQRVLAADPQNSRAYLQLAQLRVDQAELPQAARLLETGAARTRERTADLFGAAAVLRERQQEFGQAALDYRAMLSATPADRAGQLSQSLAPHLAYLSFSLPGGGPASADQAAPAARGEVARRTGDTGEGGGVPVAGGLALLARTAGMEVPVLREKDAAVRLFSLIMETAPQGGDRWQEHPIRRDVIRGQRNYRSLLQHMASKRLLPAKFDPAEKTEFVFPLTGDPDAVSGTRRFLSFFGVKREIEQAKGNPPTVSLVFKQGQKWEERQQLLHNLGVNLLDRNTDEIRFIVQDEELPLFLDAVSLAGGLLGDRSSSAENLLERIVRNGSAMKTYLALASCSSAARNAMIQVLSADELSRLSDSIATFGRFLDMRDGQLRFPGAQPAWREFLGQERKTGTEQMAELFRRDQGGPVLLYYSLAIAPPEVQAYFTASGPQLSRLYTILLHAGAPDSGNPARGLWNSDPARMLRQLAADGNGLFLPLDRRIGPYLFEGEASAGGSTGTPGHTLLPLDSGKVESLLASVKKHVSQRSPSAVEIMEFFRYVQSTRPDLLTEATIGTLMRVPTAAPAFLDLVWDIQPTPESLVRYLDYCLALAAQRGAGWNVNRTRTSQSLFRLIAGMRRAGTLKPEEARSLFDQLVARLEAGDETAFVRGVFSFVEDLLLPEVADVLGLGRDDPDLVLKALAGPPVPQVFGFDGKRLLLDAAALRLGRMKGAIRRQDFVSLPQLLAILRLLGEPTAAAGGVPADLGELAARLGEIQAVQFPLQASKRARQLVASGDFGAARKALAGAAAKPDVAEWQRLAAELYRGLHVELGVTLLTYCYALEGSPETDALAFDSNFVRKHTFYAEVSPPEPGWSPAELNHSQEFGSFMTGSISGLSSELSFLETSTTADHPGASEGRELVPTILSGLRAVQDRLLTDRAQEYVALTARLGGEILARSVTEPRLREWADGQVGMLTSASRRELVAQRLGRADPSAAAALLSPSEMFLLGESYLASVGPPGDDADARDGDGSVLPPGRPPRVICPNLDRLEHIVPRTDSDEYARFRAEVDQYGVLLRKRLGLSQLSLRVSDSYEQLEKTQRGRLLYERLCDLKIRVAELNYALGLPACFAELEGELALREIFPGSTPVRTNSWKPTLEQIMRLGMGNARGWIEELLNRGSLAIAPEGVATK